MTTPAQDRFIRLRHLRNRFLSAQSTVQALPGNQRISRQTVRNCIHGAGLRAYRPYQGNVLMRHHRQARMLWVNQHQAWTLRNHWRHVWFSDESRFLLQCHDGRRRIYRRRGGRYVALCMDEAPPHGGGGVTVWGAISNTRQESAGSNPRQPNSVTVHPGHLATAFPAIDGHSRSCVPAG